VTTTADSASATYALARKVAAGLGGGAAARPGEYGAEITDGATRLHLTISWHDPSRLEVSGVYPSTRQERLRRTSISVRIDRGPAVIAREIRSRLLPGYHAELARVTELNAGEAHDAGMREALAGKITGMFPGAFTRVTGYTGHGTEVVIPGGDGPGGTVSLSGSGASVAMTFRCVPPETAVRMLAVLAG